MSELEKGLLGLVVICVSAVVYVLKKKNGNGNGHSPSVAQLALVQSIKEHVDASERRIMENINTTRHSVNNGLQTIQAGIIQEIKDSRK